MPKMMMDLRSAATDQHQHPSLRILSLRLHFDEMRKELTAQIHTASHIHPHHEVKALHVEPFTMPVDDLGGSRYSRGGYHPAKLFAGLFDPLDGVLDGRGNRLGIGDVGREEPRL